MKYSLVFMCVVIVLLRFTLPTRGLDSHDIFKDAAHLFVGGLMGAALHATYGCKVYSYKLPEELKESAIFFWVLSVVLTAMEVAAFLIRG
jgi:hypothetical protein